MKKSFILKKDPNARAIMANAWAMVQTILSTGNDAVVTVSEKTRTLEQNSNMWAMLTDISQQILWHGIKMTPEQWKDFFSAVLKGQKSVPNPEGTGFIVLGQSTSQMTISQMSDMISLMDAFGSERGVKFQA